MNVVTPMHWYTTWLNRFFFWAGGLSPSLVSGLLTLSLIHYARWVIINPGQFPKLSPDQPEEDLKYHYMIFFSNFQRQLGSVRRFLLLGDFDRSQSVLDPQHQVPEVRSHAALPPLHHVEPGLDRSLL